MKKHHRVGLWAKYEGPKEPYDMFVLSLLQLHPNDRILDNGTGNGRFASLIEPMGCEVFAIDINLTLLTNAAERAKGQAKFHVILAEMTNLPFSEKAFDKIICVHNLWYVRDYDTAVHEMLRLVRPNGICVIDHLNLFDLENLYDINCYVAAIRALIGRGTADIGRTLRTVLRPFPATRTSVFSVVSYKPLRVVYAPKLFARRFVVKVCA